MAKTFLDLEGLQLYDTKLKDWTYNQLPASETVQPLSNWNFKRIVQGNYGDQDFSVTWENNIDENYLEVDSSDNTLYSWRPKDEDSDSDVYTPMDSKFLRFNPEGSTITVEYNGQTYSGTTYLADTYSDSGRISKYFAVGPVGWLSDKSVVPEDQKTWPFSFEIDTEENMDGSPAFYDITVASTSYWLEIIGSEEDLSTRTDEITVSIDSVTLKKLDKKFLPTDIVEDVADSKTKTEKLTDLVEGETLRISNVDYIDFVFIEPQDSSSDIVTAYDDEEEQWVTPR